MKRECLNCGHDDMEYGTRNVPYAYRGYKRVIENIRGWHCTECHEVEFDTGEGVRFASAIEQISQEIDAHEAAELARIRKKLKLTQHEAAKLTGGGPNAFSRYERGKTNPVLAVTNLFKLLDHHPNLLDEIRPS